MATTTWTLQAGMGGADNETLQDYVDQCQALVDSIEAFYLGAQASNPTVDNNGDPVTAGDWYFNTTDNATYVYDGSSWNTVSPDLIADLSPQLGGNLDLNGFDITSSGAVDISTTSNFNVIADATNFTLGGSFTVLSGSTVNLDGAGVNLQFGGVTKLATTAGGIDVTGTVTADGLAVNLADGGGVNLYGGGNTVSEASYYLAQGRSAFGYDGATVTISDNGTSKATKIVGGGATRAFFSNFGDVSFYEDTGTTAKFFWDASAERLGIGTSAPSTVLHLVDDAPSLILQDDTNTTYRLTISAVEAEDAGSIKLRDDNNSAKIHFPTFGRAIAFTTGNGTTSAEAMRVTNTGNVGIGTTSPAVKLDVVGQVRASTGILFGTDTAAANALDDYEEGTYDPTLTPQTSGSITMDASFKTLAYTKIGKRVHISGEIVVASASSPTGTFVYMSMPTGLALDALAGTAERSGGAVAYFNGTSWGLLPYRITDTNYIRIYLDASTIGANRYFGIDISYISP